MNKSHAGDTQREGTSQQPYLSPPIAVAGEQYEFTPTPVDTSAPGYRQPWGGWVPPCTLNHQDDCRYFPAQTANIKPRDIYEGIEVIGDAWMMKACDAACESIRNSGGPFGALIMQIDDGSREILRYWVNHNQVTATNDPTAHAEVMTIRSACASLGVFDLGHIERSVSKLPQPGPTSHCIIFSSAEPCPMCYSAICWAHLARVSFAATRFDAAVQGVGFSDEAIYDELAKPYAQRRTPVYQCCVDNSLDAFNLWKRSEKEPY